jgi:hypothetical protein
LPNPQEPCRRIVALGQRIGLRRSVFGSIGRKIVEDSTFKITPSFTSDLPHDFAAVGPARALLGGAIGQLLAVWQLAEVSAW